MRPAAHRRQERLCQHGRGAEIEIHLAIERLGRNIGQRLGASPAGVGDDGGRRGLLADPIGKQRDGIVVEQVEMMRPRDLRPCEVAAFDVAGDDPGAELMKHADQRAADAAAGTRHHHRATLEIDHIRRSRRQLRANNR